MKNPWFQPWRSAYTWGDAWSWIGFAGLAIAVGVTCLAAAHVSLTLLTKPDGVAVFWPAAGIASGSLIAPCPRARTPVTLAVLIASAVASLVGGRSLSATIVFALCNVGEPLLVDRKSTRLNSSHLGISYAVFFLKKNTCGHFGADGSAAGVVEGGRENEEELRTMQRHKQQQYGA